MQMTAVYIADPKNKTMAKKPLKKAQPGMNVKDPMTLMAAQKRNMDIANKAALEKVKAPPVKQFSMDEIYAASAAKADSTDAANRRKFIESAKNAADSKQAEKFNNEQRLRILDSMTTPNKKAGGAITKPITDLGMVDRMEKAKLLKGKR